MATSNRVISQAIHCLVRPSLEANEVEHQHQVKRAGSDSGSRTVLAIPLFPVSPSERVFGVGRLAATPVILAVRVSLASIVTVTIIVAILNRGIALR
jgi:hypothetical protein